MKKMKFIVTAIALLVITNVGLAQHHHTQLHVSDRWKECSIQLDSSLTQKAWHQFTQEAAMVAYFRPLIDAKPMGAGHFEIALVQWSTSFDDSDPAWNDTFVHPDSTHWLKEGSRLSFPGLTARVGITNKVDVGIYFTKNPNANYGFYSGQVQYNFLNNVEKNWYASARLSFTSLYGPEDLKLNVYGLDIIASKEFPLYFKWASISPYVGVSSYMSCSREITSKVELDNEYVGGSQAMVGTVLKISHARIGVEYNLARVNTISVKIGVSL